MACKQRGTPLAAAPSLTRMLSMGRLRERDGYVRPRATETQNPVSRRTMPAKTFRNMETQKCPAVRRFCVLGGQRRLAIGQLREQIKGGLVRSPSLNDTTDSASSTRCTVANADITGAPNKARAVGHRTTCPIRSERRRGILADPQTAMGAFTAGSRCAHRRYRAKHRTSARPC